MSFLNATHSYICIKITDWIDLAILVMQKNDRELTDFYISQLPDDTKLSQDHINEYLKLVPEDSPNAIQLGINPGEQVREQVELFIEILKENNKWKKEEMWLF